MDLINIYRAFHPRAAEYTFFSSTHGTFSRVDHMLGHKAISANLGKLKSYQSSFSTTTLWGQKPTIRKIKTAKNTRMWTLHGML